MKKLVSKLIFLAVVVLWATPLLAQETKLKSGALNFLKGEKTLNVEYAYDGLSVGKETEQAYTDKKVAEYNGKEAGKGDKWLEGWKSDRAKRFEPKFEELLNKQFFEKKIDFHAGNDPHAKYTMVLKTLNLEPGWNAAILRAPAQISTEASFYEGADRANPLAVMTILKAPGRDAMGYDFDVGYRLQEGYAKTGKELGSFLIKKALK
ncbi:MAG: hypothetical protein ABJC04_07180 [Verrucomicrobiota bacterium]